MAHPFGSEGYAREELRAEIGSLMLGEQLGIGHDPGQHAAYVAGWIKVLEQDPREIFRAAADAEKITKLVLSYEQLQEQAVNKGQTAEADHERLTPGGYTSIPWQRPELAPRRGTAQPASHYAGMIAAGTESLPSAIRAEAIGRMVDFAAPDIVLSDRPGSERGYHRSVAVGGLGQVTAEAVADLFSQRSVRQDDAERFIGDAVTLADWARGRALGAGLAPDEADQAADLSNALKSVEWGRGHPDAEDGLSMDHAGREAASKAAVAFAERGPVQASLASMVVDMETSPDVVGSFSMGQLYVRDEDRVAGLQSRGVDRSNPGADLVAPPDQPQEAEQPEAMPSAAARIPTMIREDSPAMQPPSPERTYLAVPYAEKDDAKQLGAKWDRAEKAWLMPRDLAFKLFVDQYIHAKQLDGSYAAAMAKALE